MCAIQNTLIPTKYPYKYGKLITFVAMSYILARGDLIIWNSSPVWPTTMPNCHSTILHRCQAPFFIPFLVELCNTEIQRCCGLWCSDNEKWYHPILTPMDGSDTVTARNWHWKSLTLGASISTCFTSDLLLTNSCIFCSLRQWYRTKPH